MGERMGMLRYVYHDDGKRSGGWIACYLLARLVPFALVEINNTIYTSIGLVGSRSLLWSVD